jgi:hypothetical protein
MYEKVFDESFNGIDILDRKIRKVYFDVTNRMVKNQEVVPHSSSFFMSVKLDELHPKFEHVISRIFCAIEIEDNEVDLIKSKSKDGIYIDNLIQKCLEIFFYNYNIKNIGRNFQSPNARLVAPVVFAVSSNLGRIRNEEPNAGLLMLYPNTTWNKIEHNFSLKEQINENWLYFFSKAVNDYKFFDYYDCIINSAISFESYFHYIVNNKKLDSSYLKKKNGDFRIANNIINKLYQDKQFSVTDLSKEKLDILKKIILGTRNKIIHGATIEIYNLKNDAKESIDALYEFYELQSIFKITERDPYNMNI